jgi:hypothetical protein
MVERIVDIATDGRHLAALRGFLTVSEQKSEVGRIPLDDITAVIVHAHGITYSNNLLVALERVTAYRIQDFQTGRDVIPYCEAEMGNTDGQGTSDGVANAGCGVC